MSVPYMLNGWLFYCSVRPDYRKHRALVKLKCCVVSCVLSKFPNEYLFMALRILQFGIVFAIGYYLGPASRKSLIKSTFPRKNTIMYNQYGGLFRYYKISTWYEKIQRFLLDNLPRIEIVAHDNESTDSVRSRHTWGLSLSVSLEGISIYLPVKRTFFFRHCQISHWFPYKLII